MSLIRSDRGQNGDRIGDISVPIYSLQTIREDTTRAPAREGSLIQEAIEIVGEFNPALLFAMDPDFDAAVAHHKLVDGRREYGVTYKGRIYLFSSEATLKRFWQTPDRYKSVVGEVMQSTR